MSAAPTHSLRTDILPELIMEDSIWIKIASGLPLLGLIVQLVAEKNLAQSAQEAVRKIPANILEFRKVIEIKNQYKIIGIIRDLLALVTLVTLIALAILPSRQAVLVPLFLFSIGQQLYYHRKNSAMLLDVKRQGFGLSTRRVF